MYQYLKKKYHIDKSSKPNPTTTKPITAPAENAILKPLFRLSLAAKAVRLLAIVAVFIPINPDSAEKNPPVKNANGTKLFTYPIIDSVNKTTNTTAKNIDTPLYCLFK